VWLGFFPGQNMIKNRLLYFLNPTSINSYRFRFNFTEKTGKIGTPVFEFFFEKYIEKTLEKTLLYQKLLFEFLETYTYLHLLDLEKSKVYFSIMVSKKSKVYIS
jgi:hypothetical protein